MMLRFAELPQPGGPFAVLRFQKIKLNSDIRGMADHWGRERPTPNADPSIPPVWLHGSSSADELYTTAVNVIPTKFRKNGVRLVEGIVSASPEYFRPNTRETYGAFDQGRLDRFCEAAVGYLQKRWGDRLLSAVMHCDEATPHLHVAILPTVDRPQAPGSDRAAAKERRRSPFNADALFNQRTLRQMQTEIGEALAHLGIKRGNARGQAVTHEDIRAYYEAVRQAHALHAEAIRIEAEVESRKEEVATLRSDAEALRAVISRDEERFRAGRCTLNAELAEARSQRAQMQREMERLAREREVSAREHAAELQRLRAEAERRAADVVEDAERSATNAAEKAIAKLQRRTLKASEELEAAERQRVTARARLAELRGLDISTVLERLGCVRVGSDVTPDWVTQIGTLRTGGKDGKDSNRFIVGGRSGRNAIDLVCALNDTTFDEAVAWLGVQFGSETAAATAGAASAQYASEIIARERPDVLQVPNRDRANSRMRHAVASVPGDFGLTEQLIDEGHLTAVEWNGDLCAAFRTWPEPGKNDSPGVRIEPIDGSRNGVVRGGGSSVGFAYPGAEVLVFGQSAMDLVGVEKLARDPACILLRSLTGARLGFIAVFEFATNVLGSWIKVAKREGARVVAAFREDELGRRLRAFLVSECQKHGVTVEVLSAFRETAHESFAILLHRMRVEREATLQKVRKAKAERMARARRTATGRPKE